MHLLSQTTENDGYLHLMKSQGLSFSSKHLIESTAFLPMRLIYWLNDQFLSGASLPRSTRNSSRLRRNRLTPWALLLEENSRLFSGQEVRVKFLRKSLK